MRGRLWTWIFAAPLLAAPACRSTPEPAPMSESPAPARDPTASAPRPKLEGDAVVRVGAKLYEAPTADEGFELPSLGISPGLAVHIVGAEENGRIAVDTVAASEHHCAAVLGSLAEFRVRLYVSPADLVTVLTEDVEHVFDDGTKVVLSRGSPSAVAGEFVAHGTFVRVPVDASRLGVAFAPGQPRARDGKEGELAASSEYPLHYDGRTLAEENLHHDRGTLARYGMTARADDALVVVRNDCLEVTASVTLARVQKPASSKSGLYAMKGPKDPIPQMASNFERDGVLEPDGVFRPRNEPRVFEPIVVNDYDVKADTPIWSPDGRPAGKVVTPRRLHLGSRVEGDRRCFVAPILRGNHPSVTLCFATADVVEAQRGGFSRGGGPVPRVRQDKAVVKGALDKDIVRRIVRAHINEVRHCYVQGLAKNPKLAGRIAVAYAIGSDGSVSTADVAESSVADAEVGTCIAAAVKRWKFPKPTDGAAVQVTYPFLLEPG